MAVAFGGPTHYPNPFLTFDLWIVPVFIHCGSWQCWPYSLITIRLLCVCLLKASFVIRPALVAKWGLVKWLQISIQEKLCLRQLAPTASSFLFFFFFSNGEMAILIARLICLLRFWSSKNCSDGPVRHNHIGQISIYLLKLLLLLYSKGKAALGLRLITHLLTTQLLCTNKLTRRKVGKLARVKGHLVKECRTHLGSCCCCWERERRVREHKRVTAVDVSVMDGPNTLCALIARYSQQLALCQSPLPP